MIDKDNKDISYQYIFKQMDEKTAYVIAKWSYQEPYSVYSFDNSTEAVAELMNNDYYSVFDYNGVLWGYFCFGSAARVPVADETIYYGDMLDIGLGMNPELCGKGFGYGFFEAGMSFAKECIAEEKQVFRLTVAEFNKRAIHLYGKAGFLESQKVQHRDSGKWFHIMLATV